MPVPSGPQQFIQPLTAKLVTSNLITWSDGSLFTGFLTLWIAPPIDANHKQWSKINLYGTTQEIPKVTAIPIVQGQLDQNTGVYFNENIDPPNTEYALYWYDNTWKRVYPFPAGTLAAGTVSINVNPYLVTVPTLQVPGLAPNSLIPAPNEDVGTSPSGQPIVFAIPQEYFLTGSADGVNTVFTIPVVPEVWASVFTDGQKQDISTYTRNGAVVTFNTAPTANSSITALAI